MENKMLQGGEIHKI